PKAVLLWQGMVVGVPAATDAEVLTTELANGEVVSGTAVAEFVSCFDGSPLPASKYELLAYQVFDVDPASDMVVEELPASVDDNAVESDEPVDPALVDPNPGTEASSSFAITTVR